MAHDSGFFEIYTELSIAQFSIEICLVLSVVMTPVHTGLSGVRGEMFDTWRGNLSYSLELQVWSTNMFCVF